MKEKSFETSESALIPAAAQVVYDLLCDYKIGHPSILPPQYFKSVQVVAGGRGAGTVFKAEMMVMGKASSLTMHVTEPTPGRLLQEEDAASGLVTQFRLEPRGNATQLTLHTRWKQKPGLAGWIESLIAPKITRKIYREELALIVKHFSQG